MILLTSVLSWTVVAIVLVGLFDLLRRRTKTVAEMVFAVFSGSLAMAVLQPELAESPGWVLAGLTIGGCATCNGYWLFARALFRGDDGVRWPQVAIAVGIASLILLNRATAAPAGSPWHTAVGELLTLASSTVLVLAFVEAVRGWADHRDAAERRLRIVFMAVYGACVLSATLIGALATTDATWQPVRRLVVVLCALSILVFSQWALRLRRRQALTDARSQQVSDTTLDVEDATSALGLDSAVNRAQVSAADASAMAELRSVATAIDRAMTVDRLYRNPELRTADLAEHVRSTEHKVSRAISVVLGERNFNQLINRHRIACACTLLADPASRTPIIDIAHTSGFASLGPFNRAFKATMDCTPSAYRASNQLESERQDVSPIASST